MKNIFYRTLMLIPFIGLLLGVNSFSNAEPGNVLDYKELKENKQYRLEMGLNAEEEYIQEININSVDNNSKEKHGIYLTDKELYEIETRITKQNEKIPEIKKHISNSSLAPYFAGIYIDQAKGGEINIGFKKSEKDMSNLLNEIKRIYNNDKKVKIFTAKNSYGELNELNKKIVLNKKELKEEGLNIISVSSNFKNQTVNIGINPLTEKSVARLNDLFGKTRITVFEETTEGKEDSSRYDQFRPLMGGIILEGLKCTGGFSSTGSYYITAGHCGLVGDTVNQGGLKIGTITKVANSGSVDAALIKVDNTSWLSNDLYVESPRDRNITDWQAEYEENEGDYVCQAGYKTGYSCGTVKSTYYSIREHHNMTLASYTRNGGDSGAPVFNGNQLRGIHEGYSSLGSVYSQIDNVQYALGISVRTY